MTVSKTQTTGLLELLEARWRNEIEKLPHPTADRPFKRPVFDEQYRKVTLPRVARLHAQAHHTDPYAYGRCIHDMRQGFATPSEVEQDARNMLGARRAAGITFPAHVPH